MRRELRRLYESSPRIDIENFTGSRQLALKAAGSSLRFSVQISVWIVLNKTEIQREEQGYVLESRDNNSHSRIIMTAVYRVRPHDEPLQV